MNLRWLIITVKDNSLLFLSLHVEGELWDIIVNGIGLMYFPKDNWKVKWNGWHHLNIWEKELPLFFSEGYPLYFPIARLLNELLSTCLYEYCFHCQPVSNTVTCGAGTYWELFFCAIYLHTFPLHPSHSSLRWEQVVPAPQGSKLEADTTVCSTSSCSLAYLTDLNAQSRASPQWRLFFQRFHFLEI